MMGLLWLLALLSSSHALERLSQDVYPLKYHLVLTPSMENFTYEGHLSIVLMVNRQTNTFSLDSDGLEVSSSFMTLSGYDFPLVHQRSQNGSRLHIHTDPMLQNTSPITLNINFTGPIRKELFGFYRSKYTYNGTTRYLGSTHFEASGARKAFPCFDEPLFRANFTLEVHLATGWKALSNTPVLSDQTTGNLRRIVFREQPSIPSYLVAWVVYEENSFSGHNNTVSDSCGNTTYGVWSTSAYQGEPRNIASLAAPVAVHSLEEFTGIRCQAVKDKVDLVAVPDFSAGAMENWGLITFRETMLLFDANYSTSWDREQLLMVVVHELAHQWFGNLVTPQWWAYTWLSEGFARYLQYFILGEVFPELRLSEQFVVDRRQLALEEDTIHSHPLTNENITSQSDIEDMFDVITYDKGASVIHMMSTYLGPTAFKTGINKYLTDAHGSGGVTNPQRFFSSFPTLPPEMRVWTETSAYPVIIASENNNTLSLRQVKITGWKSTNESQWLVPVSISTNGNLTWYLLQPNSTLRIPLHNNSIVLINFNQTGYYRVLYQEPERWLHPNASPVTRSLLLDDSLSLAYAGLLPYDQAFLAVRHHLADELDYLPWRTALRHLAKLRRLLDESDIQPVFSGDVLEMMANVISYVAFNDTINMTLPMKLHQVNILRHACEFGHEGCLVLAQKIVDNISDSCPEKRSAILCAGIKHGNETAWNNTLQLYISAESPAEKQLLLNSLACTTNPTLIKRLLDLLWTDHVRRHNVLSTISLICSTRTGGNVTYEYLKDNYQHIIDYFGNNTRSIRNILSSVTRYFNEAQAAELKQASLLGLNLDSFVKDLERKISWRNMATRQLTAYLTEPSNQTPDTSSQTPSGNPETGTTNIPVSATQTPGSKASTSQISLICVLFVFASSWLTNTG